MGKWSKAENRLAVYSCVFFLLFAFIFCYYVAADASGKQIVASPYGVDFGVYYAAGKMATTGAANSIYDASTHHAVLEEVLNRKLPFMLSWVYPPTFLLTVAPFSYLPYHWALALWLIVTFALAFLAVYLLVPKHRGLALFMCGFPGVLMNLRWGQNGFYNTALLGFGICFLESNPVLSGLMFGLMVYKPQLAAFPLLLLLLTKKWKVLLWSAIFALISVVTSAAIFGYQVWIEFLSVFFSASTNLLTSVWRNTAEIQPTLYSALRIWGLTGVPLQAAVLIAAAGATLWSLWIWKKTDKLILRGSVLILGIFLAMPYYIQYDLMLLSIPLVLLAYDFLENGSKAYERIILAALWFMPMVNWPLVSYTGVQICPFVVLAVMAMLTARVKRFSGLGGDLRLEKSEKEKPIGSGKKPCSMG